MTTHFIEIDGGDVQKHFPGFYGQRGRFFEIVHQDKPIGFVGIRTLHADCELEVFIFKHYRNALTKGIVLAVLDLPKSLPDVPVPGALVSASASGGLILEAFVPDGHIKKCWMRTTRKTVAKLLNAMGKYGIVPLGAINGKHIFVREFK